MGQFGAGGLDGDAVGLEEWGRGGLHGPCSRGVVARPAVELRRGAHCAAFPPQSPRSDRRAGQRGGGATRSGPYTLSRAPAALRKCEPQWGLV